MRLPCKVIEDILPLYHDNVCSEESAVLVDEHIRECGQCSDILSRLRTGTIVPEKTVDDMRPLKEIQRKLKKSRRRYMKVGICITLTVLLLVMTVLTGIWYFSYAKYYFRMADKMEQTTDADTFFTSSDYTVERDGYRFEVWMPIVWSDSGFARVMDPEGMVLFLYPEAGGSCSFWFFITDESDQAWSVHLETDMTPDFEGHLFPVRSEAEKEHIRQLVSEKQESIAAMIAAVKEQWDIELLPVSP